MYEYDDHDDDERSRGRIAVVVVALVAAGIGWFVLRPALRDDRGASPAATLVFDTESSVPVGPPVDAPSVSIEGAETSAVLSAPTPDSTTTSSSTTGVTETTLPDGRPISVTAVFMNDEITLTGAVPSDVAGDRLLVFSREYRLTPASIVNNVTIDPAVPADGGIRLIEYNSVHFAGDTNTITPEHAQQLDRIVAFMNASPNTRVHVIGNTDQHGGETRNFVISQRRAEAVVDYLVAQGIDPLALDDATGRRVEPAQHRVQPGRRRAQSAHRLRDLRSPRRLKVEKLRQGRCQTAAGEVSQPLRRGRCRGSLRGKRRHQPGSEPVDAQRRDLPIRKIVEDRIGHRDLLATRRNPGEVTRVSADEDYFRRSRALANDRIRQLRGCIESLLVQLDDRSDHLVPPLNPLADVDQLKDHIVAEVRGDVLAGQQRGDVGIHDRLRLLDAHGHRRRRVSRLRFRHRCCYDPQRRGSGDKGRGDHGDHAEATRHHVSSNLHCFLLFPWLSSPPTWNLGFE